jgi:hypothetical protein
VTYADGATTSSTFSVSFTQGTDGGSGIGTRLLQRASATLSGSTCGSYGSFATVTGGTNPTSPLVDTVSTATCYKYQYVVADNVGNTTTATSTNAAKVTIANAYSATILATSGLVNYYRFGESNGTTAITDLAGTNTGTYFNSPTLGVAGRSASDSNTAVQFDGSSDYGSIARQISTDFSIELWFKSTQGTGTGPQWYDGAPLVDNDSSTANANDCGVGLRSDGKIVGGVGNPVTSIMSGTGYNDGVWHHVVFTRSSTGPIVLYVDGSQVASGSGGTAARTTQNNITFGRSASTANQFYAGYLDEVSIYNVVLSAATVTAHHNAGL